MDFDIKDTNQILIEFQPLLYKTLQRLGIPSTHMDYEDYFQELQIKLVDLTENFEQKTDDQEAARYQFTAFAGRGLYWFGIDLLRKNKEDQMQAMAEETLMTLPAFVDEGLEDVSTNLCCAEFIQEAKKRLSADDYALFGALLEGKYSMQSLADHFGVVRDTIYRRRERIQKQLAGLRAGLLDGGGF